MTKLIVYFLGSHLISFICSIFESVLLSCSNSYILLLKKKGSAAGFIFENLKRNIDRPLAAILTLNTVSHTFGAAGVGATIVELYGDRWLALGSVILTLTMLYWTEMLPKTVGALFWKRLAPICAKPMQWLIYLTYPFVISFNFIARLLSRGKGPERITEEEIQFALDAGTKAGVIEEAEQDMVENIFRLGDRKVGMLMCPRVDIEWLDVEDSYEDLKQKILKSKFHRFPIARGNIDEIIGTVESRELLSHAWRNQKVKFEELATPPLFVHEYQHIFELMELFRKNRQTFAIVTDEYGSIQGIITIGDIMYAILKDVEEDSTEGIVPVNDQFWLIDGDLPIDEFKEFLHLSELPGEERGRYRTLSGLCMSQLEAIPKKGDVFVIGHYTFEILKVHRRRVEKILLSKKD